MPSYKIQVNGQTRSVEVPEDMHLLWVIRDVVGLTGTKLAPTHVLSSSINHREV